MDGFDLESFLEKYKLPLIFALLGLILIGLGLLFVKDFSAKESGLEIIPSQSNLPDNAESLESRQKVVVEIAGAVLKPGVYEMDSGSRVNDLLILGGGLSSLADRDWVARNINLAQKLADGAKIYIPKINETSSSSSPSSSYSQSKINVNTATIPELDTLWGVGEATARKIIEGRPYQKTEDLVNKKIVNTSVFNQIRDKITVY